MYDLKIYMTFKCLRKPDYGMASEIPLNLFFCEYDNLKWNYEEETLKRVIHKLASIWTITSTK